MLSQQVQALMEHSGLPTPAPAPAGIPALAAAAGLRPTGSASPAAGPTAAPPSGSGSDPTQLSSTPLPDAGATEQTAGGDPSAVAVAAVELLVSAVTAGEMDPPVSAYAAGSSSQLSAQRATSGLISGVSSLPSESVAQPAPSFTGDGTGGGNQNELVAKLTEYKVGARGQ